MHFTKQPLSFEEVLAKLMRYCSYQERSELEVRQKANTLGYRGNDVDLLVERLIADNFQNEKRFAEAYVRGKVNAKRWGIFKIREGLSSKGVASQVATKALNSINKKDYLDNLNYLLRNKLKDISQFNQDEKAKLYRFLLSKGYESEKVLEALNNAF